MKKTYFAAVFTAKMLGRHKKLKKTQKTAGYRTFGT